MSGSVGKDAAASAGGSAYRQRAAVRRSAWTLAVVVVLVYAGYLVWNVWRSAG